MSKTVIILNRAAGGGTCADKAGPFLKRLMAHFPGLETHWTDYPGHATELARIARQEGAETILTAGGDGTVFEVINGLFPNELGPCTLGILPLGTGNSFLRDFGITNAEQALSAILGGESQDVDIIRAEHTDGVIHYINLLSLGFSAEAGALTNRRFKGLGSLDTPSLSSPASHVWGIRHFHIASRQALYMTNQVRCCRFPTAGLLAVPWRWHLQRTPATDC